MTVSKSDMGPTLRAAGAERNREFSPRDRHPAHSAPVVRMLFTFAGGAGHFEPLAPVARAAAAAGHEVAFTCAPGMVPVVAERGFAVTATVAGEPARPPGS